MKNKIKVRNLIIIFGLFSIVILGFRVSDLQNQIDKSNEDKRQVEVLLQGRQKVAGYTCGVLTSKRAEEFLKEPVYINYGQGPTNKIQELQSVQDKILWSDSCRYESQDNNSKYVEFHIASFQSNADAFLAYSDFLPVVNDSRVEDSTGLGNKLLYDNGVYYLLKENKVIQVAASNGKTAQNEEFAKRILNELLK